MRSPGGTTASRPVTHGPVVPYLTVCGTAANANGTTYGGATPILRASTPITPGVHSLFLSIFDQGDRGFDSAAFIDNLTIDKHAPCTSGISVTQ